MDTGYAGIQGKHGYRVYMDSEYAWIQSIHRYKVYLDNTGFTWIQGIQWIQGYWIYRVYMDTVSACQGKHFNIWIKGRLRYDTGYRENKNYMIQDTERIQDTG